MPIDLIRFEQVAPRKCPPNRLTSVENPPRRITALRSAHFGLEPDLCNRRQRYRMRGGGRKRHSGFDWGAACETVRRSRRGGAERE